MLKAIAITVVIGTLIVVFCHFMFPEIEVKHFIPTALIIGLIVFFTVTYLEKREKKGKEKNED